MLQSESYRSQPLGLGEPPDQPGETFLGKYGMLLVVLFICGALRIWLIDHLEIIARDGVVYINFAREMMADPMGSIRSYNIHPLYPAAMVGVYKILSLLSLSQDLAGWVLSGQIVAFLGAIAAMVAIWLFAKLAFNRQIAWISVLLFSLGRKFAVLGADVLTDSSALAFEMWAFALGLSAGWLLERGKRRAVIVAAAGGLCAGVGYLVRPEAGLAFIPIAALWIACALRRSAKWSHVLGCVVAAFISMMVCIIPYALTIGTITKRWPIREYLPFVGGKSAAMLACQAVTAMENFGPITQLPKGLFAEMHALPATLACICLLTWILVRLSVKLPRSIRIFPSRHGVAIMIGWAVVFTPLVIARAFKHPGSNRYLLAQAALFAGLAGAGVIILAEWITLGAGRINVGGKYFRQTTIIILVALMARGMQIHSMRPIHEGKAYIRKAGTYLSENAPPDERILVRSQRVLLYSRMRGGVIPTEALKDKRKLHKYIAGWRAKYIVVRDKDLATTNTRCAKWFGSPAFVEITKFTQENAGKNPDTIRIYRINRRDLPK